MYSEQVGSKRQAASEALEAAPGRALRGRDAAPGAPPVRNGLREARAERATDRRAGAGGDDPRPDRAARVAGPL